MADPGAAQDTKKRMDEAAAQCQGQIIWFERASRVDWWLYRIFQIAVIILSGTTPVLVLFTALPKPIQALPAALAALASAIAASFHWHEDAVRWGATREQLKSELRQFRVRAGRYPVSMTDDIALQAFVVATEAIVMGELATWQTQERPPIGQGQSQVQTGQSAHGGPGVGP